MKAKLFLLFFLIFSTFACDEKVLDPQKPKIKVSTKQTYLELINLTMDVESLNNNLFEEYGFLIDTTKYFHDPVKVVAEQGLNTTTMTINQEIEVLGIGKTHYVKGYASNSKQEFFTEATSFTPQGFSVSSPENKLGLSDRLLLYITTDSSSIMEQVEINKLNIYLNNAKASIKQDFKKYKEYYWSEINIPQGLEKGSISLKFEYKGKWQNKGHLFTLLNGDWEAIDTLDFAIKGSFTSGGKIYLHDGNVLKSYSPSSKELVTKGEFPLNSHNYTFSTSESAYLGYGKDYGPTLESFWKFDAASESWAEIELPSMNRYPSLEGTAFEMVSGEQVFLLSDFFIWEFDPVEQNWKVVTELDIPIYPLRKQYGDISKRYWNYNGTIYYAEIIPLSDGPQLGIFRFNPNTKEWRVVKSFSDPQVLFTDVYKCFNVGDRMFITLDGPYGTYEFNPEQVSFEKVGSNSYLKNHILKSTYAGQEEYAYFFSQWEGKTLVIRFNPE